MSINTRTKALLLFGVIFAVCATLTIWLSGRSRTITVIGGADGPTAIFMASSGTGMRSEQQRAQLETRLKEVVEQMDGVESATVTLFGGNPAEGGSSLVASAEVHLRLAQGIAFGDEQLGAVKMLVCGATGLQEQQVSLTTTAAL